MAEREEQLLMQFMEVVSDQPVATLRMFLEATNWQLDEAIQLYFAGGLEAVAPAAPTPASPQRPAEDASDVAAAVPDEDYVRPPLPVKREALYESADLFDYRTLQRSQQGPVAPPAVDAFRNFEDEFKPEASAGGASSARSTTLASLYRPPRELTFNGTFELAKSEAAKQEKWLLVNLQSHTEFASHMLNRDTWSHVAVKETVASTFIFWQVFDDTEEGRKVCTYYRLGRMPCILVLDPITGQKMRSFEGMVSPERLLEDLLPFMDSGPKEKHPYAFHSQKRQKDEKASSDEDEELREALAASLEPVMESKPSRLQYPALPDEPRPEPGRQICRVGVRFPDGSRGQRNFLPSDPLTYLWSYCASTVQEAAGERKFRLSSTIPGAAPLEYNPNVTIQEAGVANTMLHMAWE